MRRAIYPATRQPAAPTDLSVTEMLRTFSLSALLFLSLALMVAAYGQLPAV